MDMTYWCESCARKNNCYTIRSRPKCFTPITSNDRTADRKTEPKAYCKKKDCVWWSISLMECLAEKNGLKCKYKTEQTEPQTNADQHTQHIESVEDETGRWVRVGQWEWEHHTDTTHFGKAKGESITTNKVEDKPQTETHEIRTETHECVKTEPSGCWVKENQGKQICDDCIKNTDCSWK